ncbi:MAG: tRNA (adenosine(37)-N6)-threonylcarbamoyltransferase complex ATPase subunit type 1 TsaE [Opitutales bacterium]|nr:tRNA (adenosine(37)-N6)-threonylcarbamoyltransferase complex ATPase subunit type 1 TsaE [Opitutales bacterium]
MLDKLKEGILCKSAAETAALAEALARENPQATIALAGTLGAGKTTFAKGLAKGLGISSSVKSPSYNVRLTYSENGANFVHVDAYRLKSPADYDALLIDEIAPDPKMVCVEWPQVVAEALPGDALWLEIDSPCPRENPDWRIVKLMRK